MTAESFDRALDELYQVKPFKIFSIVVKGGEVFEIDYPRALSFRDGPFLSPPRFAIARTLLDDWLERTANR